VSDASLTTSSAPIERARRHAKQKSPWIGRLGRLGMAAAGFLYCVIGFLAVELALGAGGKAADRTGALKELSGEWWGTALLVLVAVGFAGYALWRFAVAALGEKLEAGDKDLSAWKRVWYVARGIFYAFLCFTTVELLIGWHSGSENEKEQTAKVLDWPAGRWLVGAFGVGLICWGIGSVYRGVTRKFKDDLRTEQMSARTEKWVTRIGVVGYLARAVVYALIGVFFIRAAWQYDPDEAVGLDGALHKLAGQTFGPLLLGVVAAGLFAYGLFYFVRAAYRDV
jgi:uncharacterized protein DUF1206